MKTTSKILFLLATLSLAVSANAQRLNVSYTFSTGVDSTRWIALDSTAQDLLAPNAIRSTVHDIGFPFIYAGVEQTKFSVNKYGYLHFGNNLVSISQQTRPLGSNSGSIAPGVVALVGYNSIQMDTASYARYQVVGDTGSRVLVVELRAKVMDFRYSAYDYALIQIQLHEASRAVCIIYGARPNISLYSGYQLGFVGSTTDVAFIDVDSDSLTFANSTSQLNDTLSIPQQWQWYQIEYDSTYCYHYTTPWGENFNTDHYMGCWTMLDYDANAGTRWNRTGNVMRVNFSTCTSNDWLVSPPIQLPSNDDGLRLMYDYRASTNGSGACGKMQVRVASYYPGDSVDVVDTADFFTILRTEREGYAQFTPRGLSLAAYAGMQVRIAFVATGLGPNSQNVQIDNVRMEQTTSPSIIIDAPTRAFAYDTTTVEAMLIEGSEQGLTYSWHSTMADDSMATFTATGTYLSIVYSHYGTDTITCIASNIFGSDTSVVIVDVRDCTTVTEFPWLEDFEHGLDCWFQPFGGWRNTSAHGSYEGGNALRSFDGHSVGGYTITSQPIAVPTIDKMPLPELMWWMRTPSQDQYTHNEFSLYISVVDSTEIPDFSASDLVFSQTMYYGDWQHYRVPLTAYAGQTIRIRFQNIPSNSVVTYYDCVLIDKVEVRSTAVPVVELDDPLRFDQLDSNLFVANLIEGDTAGLTYIWHSTMAADSMATFTTINSQLLITYSAEGIDTVTVIASNSHGSDTAVVIVPIHNCPAFSLPFIADFEDSTQLNCWSGFISNSANDARVSYGTPWYWAGDSNNHYIATSTNRDWIVTPAIDIPDDTTDLYISWHHTGSLVVYVATGNDYFEPADFGSILYSHTSVTPVSHRQSFGTYAGQRVHLGFFNTYTGSRLDSVRIAYNDTPPIATLTAPDSSFARGRVVATATLNHCAQRALTHSWHSTMATAELARATVRDTVFTIYYLDGGIDTITYIVSNYYGDDTLQAVIVVDACNAETVPFFQDFEGVEGTTVNRTGSLPTCWGNMWHGDNIYTPHVLGAGAYPPMASYSSKAAVMMAGTTQGWDTLAYLVLPRFTDSLYRLSIALTHVHEDIRHGTLTVGYVTDTTFMPIADLPNVADSGRRDTVSFASVPDSATHIALRWHHVGIWYCILVDDIEVFIPTGMPPTVQLNGPDTATVGSQAIFTAQLRTGDTTGLTYTWHSTMVVNNMASLSTFNSQLSITYTASGTDTVTVIATNAYGADTQTTIVQVVAYYNLTALSADNTMGHVIGSGNYLEGDTATLTAVANQGYHFTHWNDGDTDAMRQIVVVSDMTFIAYFESNSVYYTVSVLSADSTMGSVTGSGTYPADETITLTATANQGYHFSHWNDGDTMPTRQIVVISDTTFTAFFESDTHTTSIHHADSTCPQFAIYPNPATGSIIISAPPQTSSLTIFDMAGHKVKEAHLASPHTRLDVSNLPAGTYFVRLGSSVKRLIIQ